MLKNKGITFKLKLYILTGILIIYTSILLLDYYSTRKLLINSLKKDVTHLAQSTVSKISGVLAGAEKIPLTLAPVLENTDNNEFHIRKTLESIVLINKEVFGACVAFEPYSFYPDQYFFAPYYYRCGDSARFKMLGEKDYDYFDLDWYQIPKVLEKPLWSEPYFDKNGGNIIMSTFSVPFYKKNNGNQKFNGIVTVDLDLSWLRNIVDSMDIIKNGFAFLISKKGTFLTHPIDSLVMNQSIFSLADEIDSPLLRQIGKQMINGETAYARFDPFDVGKKALLYYTPLPNNNWSLGIIFPEKELFADLDAQFRTMLFLGIVGVILLFVVITIISKNITRPLEKLAAISGEIGEGNFDVQLPSIQSQDEIGRLTHSFDVMKRELKVYIKNLEETTAAKNKIESELKIAHDIQQGIIPKIFPPFPDRDDVDIYAVLDPAKAVGGDLYDFFFLDDDHIIFAVGDVSGKGVPASLFMAITRTLFRAKTTVNSTVNEITTQINRELCKDNDNAMFVTFFMGILDLKTGEMEYCNAGHPFPYILRKTGEIQVVDQTHGMPVGLFDLGMYKHSKLTLEKGDSIVIYTDGIPEAINEKGDLMGSKKLESMLTELSKEISPEIITRKLLAKTRYFVGNAEQSDDITILVLTYFMKKSMIFNSNETHLEITNDIDELNKVNEFITKLGEGWNIKPGYINKLSLVAEEIITNIINYGFPDSSKHKIKIVACCEKDSFKMMFQDDGIPFDPLQKKDPILDLPAEERSIGGLGVYFVKQMMDKVEYRYEHGKNCLFIEKKCDQISD